MNKVKSFFWVEIRASEKRGDVSKMRDKKNNFAMYVRPTKF